MVEESCLQEPADRCVRLVALSLLADAQKAGDRLMGVARQLRDGDAESDDVLHDFRVAVRRLRSWIRAFKPSLRDAVSRKQRRRLSTIADATGATRDATVHLEWLREERAALTARQRVGLSWLREWLEAQRKNGSEAALAAPRDLDAMVARLTRRLNVYRSPVVAHERPERFGTSLAARLLKASDALQGDLAAIHHATDIDECHRARIAAKRLRHVLEPVSELASEGNTIIKALKMLQDSLGDLHDTHVFSKEIASRGKGTAARPGMVLLAQRLHERGARAYATVERDWLHSAGASFFDRVRKLAAEIARRASLGTEIERKYLLERLPENARAAPSVEIEQGAEAPTCAQSVRGHHVVAGEDPTPCTHGNLAPIQSPSTAAAASTPNPARASHRKRPVPMTVATAALKTVFVSTPMAIAFAASKTVSGDDAR